MSILIILVAIVVIGVSLLLIKHGKPSKAVPAGKEQIYKISLIRNGKVLDSKVFVKR